MNDDLFPNIPSAGPPPSPEPSAHESYRPILAQRTRTARKELRYKQYELERLAGLQPSVLSHVEKAKRGTSIDTLVRLCKALRESPDWLLGLPQAKVPAHAPVNTKDAEWRATIGPRLRFCRERKGLSQAALATRCGMAANTISQLEAGSRFTSVGKLVVLCIYLDVPARWVLGFPSFAPPPARPDPGLDCPSGEIGEDEGSPRQGIQGPNRHVLEALV